MHTRHIAEAVEEMVDETCETVIVYMFVMLALCILAVEVFVSMFRRKREGL